MADSNWQVEVEKINTEVQLCKQKLDLIENNHLKHIQRSIDTLNRVLWIVGLASVGILILIYKIKFSYGKSSFLSHMFALLGAMVFTIHTLILDAVIWPFFYF